LVFDKGADILSLPGRAARGYFYGLGILAGLDACPPGGTAYGEDRKNLREPDESGLR